MDSSSAHAPARRPGADRPSPDSLADAFAAELSRELGRDGLSAAEDAFVAQMHEDCVGDEGVFGGGQAIAPKLAGEFCGEGVSQGIRRGPIGPRAPRGRVSGA